MQFTRGRRPHRLNKELVLLHDMGHLPLHNCQISVAARIGRRRDIVPIVHALGALIARSCQIAVF